MVRPIFVHFMPSCKEHMMNLFYKVNVASVRCMELLATLIVVLYEGLVMYS
jgi:hypothetical protein